MKKSFGFPCLQGARGTSKSNKPPPKPKIVPEKTVKPKNPKQTHTMSKADRTQQRILQTKSVTHCIAGHILPIDSELAQQAKDPKVFRVGTLKSIYDQFEKDIIRPMEEVVLFAYWKPGAARTKKQYHEMMGRKLSKPVAALLDDMVVRLRMYKDENEELQQACTQALVNKKQEEGAYKKVLAQLRRQIRRTEHSNWNNEDENNLINDPVPALITDPRAFGAK